MTNRDKKFVQVLLHSLIAAGLILLLSFRASLATVIMFSVIPLILTAGSIYAIRVYSIKLYKLCFIGWVVVFILFTAYSILAFTGAIEIITDAEYLQSLIGQTEASRIIFIAVAFLQVTLIPFLPSTVVIMVGAFLFGMWRGVFYSFIGILLGAAFAFLLGRVFGMKLVKWIAGAEAVEKYKNIATGKNQVIFFFMMLVPLIFPNSLLYLIAGMTGMKFWVFILIVAFGSPPGIMLGAAIGDGVLNIPFAGTGLLIWAAIGMSFVLLFYALTRYSQPATVWLKDYMQQKRRERVGSGEIEAQDAQAVNACIVRTVDIFYREPKIITKEKRARQRKYMKYLLSSRKP